MEITSGLRTTSVACVGKEQLREKFAWLRTKGETVVGGRGPPSAAAEFHIITITRSLNL
jgi:hypothetical protein